MRLYILSDKTALRCKSVLDWAKWMELHNRRVAFTNLSGVEISTVFLGVDHSYSFIKDSDPLLFETMVFYSSGEMGVQLRYFTWGEAEAGHAEVVAAITDSIEHSRKVSAEIINKIRCKVVKS